MEGKSLAMFLIMFGICSLSLGLMDIHEFNYQGRVSISYATHLIQETRQAFYPIKVLDSFEISLGTIATWWDIDGTKVYRREFVKGVAHLGSHSMLVKFRKGERKYAWSFFAFQPTQDGINNDFSKYDKLIFWIYVPKTYKGRPLELLVKFEDKKGRGWEQKLEFNPRNEWQLAEVDLRKAKKIDLKTINNVLFFAEPGRVPSAGKFWIDDICLIKEDYEVSEEPPSIPQIIELGEEFGLVDIRWRDEAESGAIIYELWMADNEEFTEPTIFILNGTSLQLLLEEAGNYYFKVRALSNYPEFGGKWSKFSQVMVLEYEGF